MTASLARNSAALNPRSGDGTCRAPGTPTGRPPSPGRALPAPGGHPRSPEQRSGTRLFELTPVPA
ncbi:hypothetical protein PBV52_33330 [Streptomyces sp. T12]|uniref:hypothetical protein n=1 Tax=Streptomyces sp. T12 TaxID=477697 RepID=UPI0023655074|nr:hypothetical protein [Streptomyces sp. T12]WDF41327.1 hypothetical protein PBV52_33330 [Streptomyces sp. T12]